MNKKFLSVLLALILIIQFNLCGCSSGELTLYDSNSNLLAVITDLSVLTASDSDNGKSSYIEIVLNEAAEIISEIENCSTSKAKEKLISDGYTINTHFVSEVYSSVKKTYENEEYNGTEFGCAITNNFGKLLAVYSGGDNNKNFAILRTPPYSSIKPLSVYTPAIESGTANWSSLYVDSPVKTVIIDGSASDWPTNADGTYANTGITVNEAVKRSLNTIAVKCLMDYGVTNSVNFLKQSFDFPLTKEENLIASYGDEEVLGNLGMGYLREGVSPVEMAGYYQIFANGGMYTQPKTVNEIKDSSGNTIYKFSYEPNQIIKASTASLMNLLLQEVTSYGGTAEKADCGDITSGGKTGTGDYGNWFVGFTPEYSCAVWHGTQLKKNRTAEIFADIINAIPDKRLKSFSVASDIKRAVYCKQSGLIAGNNCYETAFGYYSNGNIPQNCDLH